MMFLKRKNSVKDLSSDLKNIRFTFQRTYQNRQSLGTRGHLASFRTRYYRFCAWSSTGDGHIVYIFMMKVYL